MWSALKTAIGVVYPAMANPEAAKQALKVISPYIGGCISLVGGIAYGVKTIEPNHNERIQSALFVEAEKIRQHDDNIQSASYIEAEKVRQHNAYTQSASYSEAEKIRQYELKKLEIISRNKSFLSRFVGR